jgi:hypothetical protein
MISKWVLKNARHLTAVSPNVFDLLVRTTKARVWMVENAISNNFLGGHIADKA